MPNGETVAKHGTSKKDFTGAKKMKGFQLRYIYLIDKSSKIKTQIIPFSKIDEVGAGMYKGESIALKDRKLSGEVDSNSNS